MYSARNAGTLGDERYERVDEQRTILAGVRMRKLSTWVGLLANCYECRKWIEKRRRGCAAEVYRGKPGVVPIDVTDAVPLTRALGLGPILASKRGV